MESSTLGSKVEPAPREPMPVVAEELDLLASLVPLSGAKVIELGCGAGRARAQLVARYADAQVMALEIDPVQHRKNLANPVDRISFIEAGAQSIPAPDSSFDLAMMLKSLHHVSRDLLDAVLQEAARVLRPGGLLYVSEPVFAGALNEVQRLYNDEEVVRREAIAALDRVVAGGYFRALRRIHFVVPVRVASFAAFRARSIDVSFADRRLSTELLAEVQRRFERHLGADGAQFEVPMRVDLLERT